MVYSMQNKLRPRILQTKSSIVFSDENRSLPSKTADFSLNIELMISQIAIQDSDRIISVALKSGLPMFFVLYSTIFNL